MISGHRLWAYANPYANGSAHQHRPAGRHTAYDQAQSLQGAA
ncbi:hypothetical protein [Streptomyces sp. TP-A0875]|nr:hypothetical protein [Streptomyces sp. TP-A0875]